jgi:hypothetical protein
MSIEAVEWNAAGAAGAFEIFIALEEGGFCPALDDISKSVFSRSAVWKKENARWSKLLRQIKGDLILGLGWANEGPGSFDKPA